MMELTFLGTSAGVPTARRNVSGVALRTAGRWDLFDCGEATQHRVLQTSLSLPKLQRIFISHLHGDHCFGLFGVLGSRSMDGADSPLAIIGPPGLRNMVETVMEASSTFLTYPIDYVEVPPEGGRVVEGDVEIDAVPLTHRVPSFGWWIREGDRPGRFDVERAASIGVPAGPLFGRLQGGESVVLDDGRRIEPGDVIGPVRPGRRIVIAGDNSAPAELLERTGALDVLVHEATYTEPVLASIGDDRGHSTAAGVARAAQAAGVRHLVLTHFSPRFGHVGGDFSIADVEREAREHFGGTLHLANDLDHIDVAVDGASLRITPSAIPDR